MQHPNQLRNKHLFDELFEEKLCKNHLNNEPYKESKQIESVIKVHIFHFKTHEFKADDT